MLGQLGHLICNMANRLLLLVFANTIESRAMVPLFAMLAFYHRIDYANLLVHGLLQHGTQEHSQNNRFLQSAILQTESVEMSRQIAREANDNGF